MKKIAYEPHPVSRERKAELKANGFTIVDARFDPNSSKPSLPSRSDIGSMKKTEVKQWLSAHGCETFGSLAEMRSRLLSAMFLEV